MKYNTGKSTWEHGEAMNGHNEWHTYLGPCPDCGSRTFDYGGNWRCLELNCFNSYTNPISSVGPRPEWWNKGINVVIDGNMWMAHGEDFINIQESHVAFGETPNEAVKEYLSTKSNVHPVFEGILKTFLPNK